MVHKSTYGSVPNKIYANNYLKLQEKLDKQARNKIYIIISIRLPFQIRVRVGVCTLTKYCL